MKNLKIFFFTFGSLLLSLEGMAQNCIENPKDILEEFKGAVSFGSYGGRPRVRSDQKLKSFLEDYRRCETKINLSNQKECFSNAVSFAQVLERKQKVGSNGGGLGFEVTSEEYFRKAPKNAISLPEKLKDGLPEDYRKVAKENGWKVLEYSSRTVGNPGSTRSYRRVLILANEKGYDKWIQFTVGNYGSEETPERLVDFIAVKDNPQDRKIYFNQFWRNEEGKKPIRRDHAGKSFDNCYSCHPNGVRNISPLPGSVSKDDTSTLNEFRDKLNNYGEVDWDGAIDPKGYGPHLGSEQACTKCHNNFEGDPKISRGALNYSTEQSHIEHKLSGDFSMTAYALNSKGIDKVLTDINQVAKNFSLSESQKKNLERKIYDAEDSERASVLIDWLHRKRKLTRKQKKEYEAVIEGSDDFPDCIGKRVDCYEGLQKAGRRISGSFRSSDKNKERFDKWLTEDCSTETATSSQPDTEVSNTERENIKDSTNSGSNVINQSINRFRGATVE